MIHLSSIQNELCGFSSWRVSLLFESNRREERAPRWKERNILPLGCLFTSIMSLMSNQKRGELIRFLTLNFNPVSDPLTISHPKIFRPIVSLPLSFPSFTELIIVFDPISFLSVQRCNLLNPSLPHLDLSFIHVNSMWSQFLYLYKIRDFSWLSADFSIREGKRSLFPMPRAFMTISHCYNQQFRYQYVIFALPPTLFILV